MNLLSVLKAAQLVLPAEGKERGKRAGTGGCRELGHGTQAPGRPPTPSSAAALESRRDRQTHPCATVRGSGKVTIKEKLKTIV